MNKNWYLLASVLGVLGTFVVAAQHLLGWTVLGIVSVGCNIYNYLNS